jgi:hypothetical protein
MPMECLPSETEEELVKRFLKSREFQFTHNALVADIRILFEALKLATDQQKPVLIRALYKEFFSMVEADLYLINQFNPYDGYNDNQPLTRKFKKSYRKHAKDFKKADLHTKYQSAEFGHFLAIIDKRHHFTHPKGRPSLKVIADDLTKLEYVFNIYRVHINALMTDVGFELQLPITATQEDANRLLARLKAEDTRLNAQ